MESTSPFLCLRTSKYGVFHFTDTGVPKSNSVDYTTVIILHGYVFHKDIFIRMAEYADKYNTRLVFINRRGYPGSDSYTDEELGVLLNENHDQPVVKANWQKFFDCRALELYEFLSLFSKNEHIPPYVASEDTGGIVLVGWSFGSAFVVGLLASIRSFPFSVIDGVNVKEYLRRVVLYDPGYTVLGYPPPSVPYYDPILNTDIKNQTNKKYSANFAFFIQAYYNHGAVSSVSDLYLGRPPDSNALRGSTVLFKCEEEQDEYIYTPEGSPGGSDRTLYEKGVQLGLFDLLRRRALYFTQNEAYQNVALPSHTQALFNTTNINHDDFILVSDRNLDANLQSNTRSPIDLDTYFYEETHSDGCREDKIDEWPNLEVMLLWCDQSAWLIPYAMLELKAECAAAKSTGKAMRNVRFVRLRGANHFAHWDAPEQTLQALLSAFTDSEFACDNRISVY